MIGLAPVLPCHASRRLLRNLERFLSLYFLSPGVKRLQSSCSMDRLILYLLCLLQDCWPQSWKPSTHASQPSFQCLIHAFRYCVAMGMIWGGSFQLDSVTPAKVFKWARVKLLSKISYTSLASIVLKRKRINDIDGSPWPFLEDQW